MIASLREENIEHRSKILKLEQELREQAKEVKYQVKEHKDQARELKDQAKELNDQARELKAQAKELHDHEKGLGAMRKDVEGVHHAIDRNFALAMDYHRGIEEANAKGEQQMLAYQNSVSESFKALVANAASHRAESRTLTEKLVAGYNKPAL